MISPTLRSFSPAGRFWLGGFLVLALTSVAYGQDAGEQKPESDVEILNQAELDIQRLVSRQFFLENHLALSVNRKLTAVLERDPDSSLRSRIEADLQPVREYLANKDLALANFYLNREHGGTRGAEARLLKIVTDFPQFSRMDEVLWRLSTIAVREERTEDARTHLQKLICRYPSSAQLSPAFDRLAEVGYGDWQGCDKLKQ